MLCFDDLEPKIITIIESVRDWFSGKMICDSIVAEMKYRIWCNIMDLYNHHMSELAIKIVYENGFLKYCCEGTHRGKSFKIETSDILLHNTKHNEDNIYIK